MGKDRFRIKCPRDWSFSTELSVRIQDINYGGHLANDALLGLIHEARLRWLVSLGCSEKDIGGVGLILTQAILEYRAEVFHGDQLQITLAVKQQSRLGMDLVYQVRRLKDQVETARVQTSIVAFDYVSRKVASLPESFVKAIQSFCRD